MRGKRGSQHRRGMWIGARAPWLRRGSDARKCVFKLPVMQARGGSRWGLDQRLSRAGAGAGCMRRAGWRCASR